MPEINKTNLKEMNGNQRQKEKFAFSTTLLNTRFFNQHQYTDDRYLKVWQTSWFQLSTIWSGMDRVHKNPAVPQLFQRYFKLLKVDSLKRLWLMASKNVWPHINNCIKSSPFLSVQSVKKFKNGSLCFHSTLGKAIVRLYRLIRWCV